MTRRGGETDLQRVRQEDTDGVIQEPRTPRVVVPVHQHQVLVSSVPLVDQYAVRLPHETVVLGCDQHGWDVALLRAIDGCQFADIEVGGSQDTRPDELQHDAH